jgi:hypothetical protein
MAPPDRELSAAISSLATAILDAGSLKGADRGTIGVELERALKRFAERILAMVKEQQAEA